MAEHERREQYSHELGPIVMIPAVFQNVRSILCGMLVEKEEQQEMVQTMDDERYHWSNRLARKYGQAKVVVPNTLQKDLQRLASSRCTNSSHS